MHTGQFEFVHAETHRVKNPAIPRMQFMNSYEAASPTERLEAQLDWIMVHRNGLLFNDLRCELQCELGILITHAFAAFRPLATSNLRPSLQKYAKKPFYDKAESMPVLPLWSMECHTCAVMASRKEQSGCMISCDVITCMHAGCHLRWRAEWAGRGWWSLPTTPPTPRSSSR